MTKKKILLLLTFVVSSSIFSQNKKQYTNFQDTVFNIKEVVIKAKQKEPMEALKLDVPLRYLPVSTNTISAKMLENRGIQNLSEVGRFLPGINIRTSYGAFEQINMRGFNNAIIMIDGVRDERSGIENSYLFMDLSSVESIEYIKGPASALFGHSTIGGVINIKRKKAVAKPSLSTTLAYSSFNRKQVWLHGSAPITKRSSISSNFNYSWGDGWRNTGNKRLSGYLAFNSKLSKNGNLDIRLGGNNDFYGTEIGLPPLMPNEIYKASDNELYLKKDAPLPNLDRTARYNNESDFCYNRAWNISARYTHKFNDAILLSNKLSYSYDDIDYFGTEKLSYMTSDEAIYKHYYKTGKNKEKRKYIDLDSVQLTFPLRFSHIAKTVNNQFDLKGKFDLFNMQHHYNAGYTFVSTYRPSFSGYNLGVDVKGPGLYSKVAVHNPKSAGPMTASFGKYSLSKFSTHGIYINDLVELNEYFKLQLSGRLSFYDYASTAGKTNDGLREYDEPKEADFKRVNTKAFTYKSGLVYTPNESLSTYVSYSSFFQPYRTTYSEHITYINGAGKEFFPVSGKELFKPRTGNQIEIGAQIALHDKVSLNTSLYYIKMKNIVSRLASKGDEIEIGGNKIILKKDVRGQVGNYESKGFDLDLTYSPTKNYSLKAGYSYTKARNLKLSPNDYIKISEDDKFIPTYTPIHNFYTYGAYNFTEGWMKNLGLHMDLSYNDRLYMNYENTRYRPSYWMLDAGASYRFINNKLILALNLYNILNQDYISENLGTQLTPGMPFNFRISATYKL